VCTMANSQAQLLTPSTLTLDDVGLVRTGALMFSLHWGFWVRARLSVGLSVCLSACLSVCLSVCLLVCMRVHFFPHFLIFDRFFSPSHFILTSHRSPSDTHSTGACCAW
jgi:hypothetical protein